MGDEAGQLRLVVHRAGAARYVHRPLCDTRMIYQVTDLACTYVEHESGRVDVAYVDAPVDCMSCLVEEARRTSCR